MTNQPIELNHPQFSYAQRTGRVEEGYADMTLEQKREYAQSKIVENIRDYLVSSISTSSEASDFSPERVRREILLKLQNFLHEKIKAKEHKSWDDGGIRLDIGNRDMAHVVDMILE